MRPPAPPGIVPPGIAPPGIVPPGIVPPRAMTRGAAALVSLWLACAAPLSPAAADPSDTARQAARALNDATVALQDATRAEDRVAALTRTLAGYEDGLAALRASLRTVTLRETALERQFAAQSAELGRLLGMLMAVERTGGSRNGGAPNGGPQILLHPAGPLGTARAGMMLADMTPAMAARVAALRADLTELQALHAVQDTALAALQSGMEAVQTARSDLGLALSERSDLPRRITDDPVTLAVLLAASDTLDIFARQLAATAALGDDTSAQTPFSDTQGTLPLPVRGTLLRGAGQPDAAGIARPGILIATTPGALVTTPAPATIRYAGPLLDYGNVIILEPDQGYLLILGGLERIFGAAGEVLPAGAALGFMPPPPAPPPARPAPAPATDDTTAATPLLQQGNLSETLYIELRSDGNTVDPADWFALSGG